ncbi:MAG: 2-dehydropantoate 2-reductase [Deltaproteobacteria bacterium]|nr:2-dehydropantoate 2-reductase [Deltaproteobacteria bacterium]
MNHGNEIACNTRKGCSSDGSGVAAGYPVAVLGAGALGSFYGAVLAAAGCRVCLISRRPEHRARIREHGLTLVGPEGERLVHGLETATDASQLPFVPRLLLVLVKSYDTETAISQAVPYLAPESLVLTLQNGLGNLEALEKYVSGERLLGGVSLVGANYLEPGRIRHTGFAATALGSALGRHTPEAEEVGALFRACGLPCRVTDNCRGLIWNKFLLNVSSNAIGALTRLPNKYLAVSGQACAADEAGEPNETCGTKPICASGEAGGSGLVNASDEACRPQIRSLMRALLDEALAVARARGIRLEAPGEAYSLSQPEAVDLLELALSVFRNTGENRVSMLQDVLAGRRTEITALNGAIVREARQLGLAAPVNEMITNLVLLLEKSYLPEK